MLKNFVLFSITLILIACVPVSVVPTKISLNDITDLPNSELSTISHLYTNTTLPPKATNTFAPTFTSIPIPAFIPCEIKVTSFDHR